MSLHRLTRLWRATDGITAVEFAIIFPVFLLFVFGTFEFGRAYWIWTTMQLAVDEGGRYGMVYGTGASGPYGPTGGACTQASLEDSVKCYAKTQLYGLKAADFDCASGSAGCISAARAGTAGTATATLTITATYKFASVVPKLLNLTSGITLTRTSTVPLV